MSDPTRVDSRLAGLGLWLRAPGPDDSVEGIMVRATTAARVADRAGSGSLWVSEPDVDGSTGVPYEAYSLLGALAVKTELVHLGVVADHGERRAPSILAKIVTGIDVISHGRAVLALDVDGSNEADIERHTEALAVCRAVLKDELPTWSGDHYAVNGAVNRPGPVQAGGVPIVVFVRGVEPVSEDLLAAVTGRADVVVVEGGPDRVASAVRMLGEQTGRSAGPAETGVFGTVTVGPGLPAASVAGAAAEMRAAGARGCLVGIPFPWDPEIIGDLTFNW